MLNSLDFFCNDTATTDIYTYCHTLSLHDALPISCTSHRPQPRRNIVPSWVQRSGVLPTKVRWSVRTMSPRSPIAVKVCSAPGRKAQRAPRAFSANRSEEHTSELQSLMRISYAVFCLKKKNNTT